MLILNLHFILFQPLIPLSSTTAWLGGTTASVLPLRCLSGTTAQVPRMYRCNTEGGSTHPEHGRYLARYFRLGSFSFLASLSGTSALVPLWYRWYTEGGSTQAEHSPVLRPVLDPQAVLPQVWAVLPPKAVKMSFPFQLAIGSIIS